MILDLVMMRVPMIVVVIHRVPVVFNLLLLHPKGTVPLLAQNLQLQRPLPLKNIILMENHKRYQLKRNCFLKDQDLSVEVVPNIQRKIIQTRSLVIPRPHPLEIGHINDKSLKLTVFWVNIDYCKLMLK